VDYGRSDSMGEYSGRVTDAANWIHPLRRVQVQTATSRPRITCQKRTSETIPSTSQK